MASFFRQWLISLAVLVAVFSPFLILSYAHLDQYRYFDLPREERVHCAQDVQFTPILKELARPLAAGIECVIWSSVSERSDLRLFRFLTILTASLVSALIAFVAQRRMGIAATPALILGLWATMLPGFSNLVSMANIAPVVGVGLATLAFGVSFQRLSAARLCLSVFLILLAHFCYPAVAYFGLMFIAIEVWRQGDARPSALVKNNIWLVLACGVSSVLFFAIVKYGFRPTLDSKYYSFRVSTDIAQRLGFAWEFVKRSTNLWIFLDIRVAWVIFIAFAVWRAGRSLATGTRVACTFALAFVAGLPIFASGMAEYLFRIAIPTQACFVAVFWYLVHAKRTALIAVTVVAALITSLSAWSHATNSRREFDAVTGQLRQWAQEDRFAGAHRLWYVGPKRLDVRNGLNGLRAETDEFNTGATLYADWAVAFELQAAAREAGLPQKFTICKNTEAPACDPLKPDSIPVIKVNDRAQVVAQPGDLVFDAWQVIGWKKR